MPLLALSKQWLNPDLGFLIRLFVCLGLVIRGYTIQTLLIYSTEKDLSYPALPTSWKFSVMSVVSSSM